MWYHFEKFDEKDHSVKLPVVNFGAFGAWWQIKQAKLWQIGLQALVFYG